MSIGRWMAGWTSGIALAVALSTGSCSGGSSGTHDTGGDGGAGSDATTTSCTTDAQCLATVPPTTPASCATGKCNAVQGTCEYVAKDEDGDGHAAANCKSNSGVMVSPGDDCNDHDPKLYPGHPESCSTAEDGGMLPADVCKAQFTCLTNGTESPCTATLTCNAGESCVMAKCTGGCDIGGTPYAAGQADPTDACKNCQPLTSPTGWTNVTDGTSCGAGLACAGGVCGAQCFIGGTLYAAGVSNPTNACQVCTPGLGTGAWSAAPMGTACVSGDGATDYCQGQTCTPGCLISGAFWSTGAQNPNDPCQLCAPTTSTTAWTNQMDGTGCGNGQVCAAGQCGSQCDIGGTLVSTGAANPNNTCQSCQPGTSTSSWTNIADGTSCAANEVCSGGSCQSGCFIGGTYYPASTPNSSNSCQACLPAVSTTGWSNVADGTSCGTGGDEFCSMGSCEAGCDIVGTVYASGALNPAHPCQSCQPSQSTTIWSKLPSGTACAIGGSCGATGLCSIMFNYQPSQQSLTLPAGITEVSVQAAGAEGGCQAPGNALGGSVTATITTTPGETLAISVGGAGPYPSGSKGGYNGGGPGSAGGGAGGGASDVRQGGNAVPNRVVVAGGGGGCAAASGGGPGGNLTGGAGVGGGGGGGTQTGGGAGQFGGSCGGSGYAGKLAQGGGGSSGCGAGGGGGGGYYGGGGGDGGNAGGGSSYAISGATGVAMQQGVQSGNGSVVISF